MKVKVISNTQVGSDSIEHWIGKEFEAKIVDNEMCVVYEGGLYPLVEEEYEKI